MGQTLTNGIFLPNEGERKCYTGLAGNWRAIDGYIGDYNVHVADVVIHVSQADRDKWDAVDNKADASALTAHTGNTTIHVTAEDKNKWDAVTSKANDADVVHKAGAETIAGPKTFSDTVTVPSINGINPGSLSLPDLTAGVDISAYITDITGASNINKFTPTADGWISIGLANADFIEIYIPASLMGGSFTKSTVNNYGQAFLPVMANKEVHIALKGTSIGWAKFYPCRGNI